MIMPNAVALALEGQGARAGGAAAWIGALQFGVGGASSAAVSAGHATPALAMAATILVLALIAGSVLIATLASSGAALKVSLRNPRSAKAAAFPQT